VVRVGMAAWSCGRPSHLLPIGLIRSPTAILSWLVPPAVCCGDSNWRVPSSTGGRCCGEGCWLAIGVLLVCLMGGEGGLSVCLTSSGGRRPSDVKWVINCIVCHGWVGECPSRSCRTHLTAWL